MKPPEAGLVGGDLFESESRVVEDEGIGAERASIRTQDGDGLRNGVDRSLQLFAGGGEFTTPLRELFIDLPGQALLLCQERLVPPNRRVMHHEHEEASLGVAREIRSPRTGNDDAEPILEPDS
jgi:hypothetical protein